MRFFKNLLISLTRLLLGVILLCVAAGVPAYFTAVDKNCVVASNTDKDISAPKLSQLYLDAAKVSASVLVAESAGDYESISSNVKKLYLEHPNWIAGGGDDPFFEMFFSSLDSGRAAAPQVVYPLLSTEVNRRKLQDFLSQSNNNLVNKILSLRDLNSTLLPPVYTSAGAPLDAAILINALLIQTGDFKQKFLREISDLADNAKTDQSKKLLLEKHFLATLVFARSLDWTQLRAILEHFDSSEDFYEFSKLCASCKDSDSRRLVISGMLLSGSPKQCTKYLSNISDSLRKEDFAFAFLNGSGSLNFLLNSNKPIYRNSKVAKEISKVTEPIKVFLGEFCAKNLVLALVLKVVIALLGGYFFVRGIIRIFILNRDTPSWYSPLALLRGFLEASVVALTFFILVEPSAFTIKIESGEKAPELRFAFEKTINNIQEDIMKLDTDTATLAAVGLFFVLQFMVYTFSLIRISAIKREKGSAELKLHLLENEDNLFDLNLYIGLAGTVISLVLLTVGVVSASLMAAYTSTLFGILFTALIKIVHLRRYRRKLLLEISK